MLLTQKNECTAYETGSKRRLAGDTRMAKYQKLGMHSSDGIWARLVDEDQKPLPFLNSKTEKSHNDCGLSAPTKPQAVSDIAIPIKAGQVPDWFFPHNNSRFTVGTDDEQIFECRFIEQGNSSGLHFTQGIEQIQQYFRKRLTVASGAHITSSDFSRYGTYSFLMFRLEETIYFLDFSPDFENASDQNLLSAWREVILETKSPQYAARYAQKEARERGLPVYPGRLTHSEPLPQLSYNLGKMVVIRQQSTSGGDMFQVTLEQPYK
jgi:hypothetical protein